MVGCNRTDRFWRYRLSLQILLEEFQNSSIFVVPTAGLTESVRLDRVHGHVPVGFPELNQSLSQSDGVFEEHIVVDHAVTDQQRFLESVREVDWRALFVGFRICVRSIQDLAGITMIVVCPVSDGP